MNWIIEEMTKPLTINGKQIMIRPIWLYLAAIVIGWTAGMFFR